MVYNMDFSRRVSSLQHITLVQVTHLLWKKSFIASSESPLTIANFMGTVETDIQRISNMLPLPHFVKMMLINVYKNMNADLFAWYKYHSQMFRHTFQAIKPNIILSWTADGYIDRQETARTLIRNINIDISERYKLACTYCFEDDIPILYSELVQSDRILLITHNWYDYSYQIVNYWSHKMEKGECANHFICTNPIIFAAVNGNKLATKYFLHQLSPENRNKFLVSIAVCVVIKRNVDIYDGNMFKEHYSDVLCFLIDQMSENQFKELLSLNHYYVLYSFLDWPWQVCLTNVMNRFSGCLSEDDYLCVLKRVVFKFERNCKDVDYRSLFKEFWHDIPAFFKKCLLNKFGDCILSLFRKMKFAFHTETLDLEIEER